MPIIKKEKGLFGKLSERIGDVLMQRSTVDEEMLDELEEVLITSDIGMDTTMRIMEDVRDHVKINHITRPEQVKDAIVNVITYMVDKGGRNKLSDKTPLVILMIGINGGGKTTSIAKLGNLLKNQGRSVMFAAADTFRPAAGEQLKIWGDRIGAPVVMHGEGADPSAVVFDAIRSAKAKNTDVLIVDTAGRLQTKRNLMAELEKIKRVISREYPEADLETMLVLDATTGKNAISQAEVFNESAEITGIFLTKMDGTAKGGIAITVTDQFDIPIKFLGIGEGIDDIEAFDPRRFAGGIFSE